MGVKQAVLTAAGAISALAFSGIFSAPVLAAPAASAADSDYCPVHVRVYALKDLPNELAFVVWSDGAAGAASGSITAYVNGNKYAIPFSNATAPDESDSAAKPTPIVVKFDAPAQFESAYVGQLDGGDCAVHEPFVLKPLTTVGFQEDTKVRLLPDHAKDWPDYLAQAAAMPPLTAPPPVPEEKLSCSVPYVPAAVKTTTPPDYPLNVANFFSGNLLLKLALGADGKVSEIVVNHPDKLILDKAYSNSAAFSVQHSTFTPEIYRCSPVTTDFYFVVSFSQDDERRNQDFRPATGGQMGAGAHS